MTHTLYTTAIISSFDCVSALDLEKSRERSRSRPAPLDIGGRRSQRSLLWYMPSPRDSISDELESLVARFARFAGRVAHDRGLHQEDLDELLQELRVRFWRARKDGLRDLSAGYVRRTAISAALDIIRRHRADRNVSIEDEGSGAPPLATVASNPAELLDQSELAQLVAMAVEGLAPPRRAAVRLYLDGYRREEIAELLRWSDAKTRNLLYRGLADLRAVLITQGIGAPENVQ
jgi:RNA polymerase sigma factor (sigma-70 family)